MFVNYYFHASANNRRQRHYVFRSYVRLSVRPLRLIPRYAISLYLVDGFQ